MHGQAVLEAMHAARILGDIAAQRAGNLRRGIGRVIQAMRRRCLRDREVAHAGLDHRQAGQRIEVQDLVEAGQGEHDALGVRHRPARQAGARAARHHRHAQLAAGTQDGDDLRLALRQADGQRQLTVGGEAVTFVGTQIFLVEQQAMRRQDSPEPRGKGGSVGQEGFFGGLHGRILNRARDPPARENAHSARTPQPP